MSFIETTHRLFDQVSESAFGSLLPGEELSLRLDGEDQTYVRFNQAKVRQATAVAQNRLSLRFQKDGRSLGLDLDLCGNFEQDAACIDSLLRRGRIEAQVLPEDSFMVPLQNHGCSEHHHDANHPGAEERLVQIAETAADLDFTGLMAVGPQVRAVRDSRGTYHWFGTDSFFVDYSLFTVNAAGENKAVKGLHSGRQWQPEAFARAIAEDKARLELLKRPARSLQPGEYRAFLSPAAIEKLVHMFSWGAVSHAAWKRGGSALQKLADGEVELSELFSLKENFLLGLAPPFNSLGELAPVDLSVIERGRLQNLLVSSRSAKEYGLPSNGADLGEGLRSPDVAGGNLPGSKALAALDTGLYLGNLHYLNWSDPQNARVTGMTRHACFWVENGEIAAPIRDLRFDESLYRMFGSQLEALTCEAYLFPSTDTYHRRALGGSQVPGALVKAFRFTL